MISRTFFAALLMCLITAQAHAQQGDKKGEAQAPRIPKEKIPPAPPLAPDEALKQFDGGTWTLDALAYLDTCRAAGLPAVLERKS